MTRFFVSTPAPLCIFALLSLGTSAQAQQQALVLDATPIYRQVPVAHKECVDVPTQERCTTVTTYEEQVIGYDVLYEYEGKQHTKRMAYDPGTHIPVDQTPRSGNYSSTGVRNADVVVPGQKSYSSSIPGAPVVESIQHSSPASAQPPIIVNVDAGHRSHQRPSRKPEHTAP